MSKDAPDLHDLPLTQETPATQTSLETFNAFLNAPVTKLDADEYKANDLDGVTEGLLGSGNLNFLMMQAGQTDEAMSNSNPFDIASSDINLAPVGLLGGNSYTPIADAGAGGDNATDRAFDMPNALDGLAASGLSGLSNKAGTLGASSAAANSTALNPLTDSSFFSSTGSNGTNGSNGNDGTSGNGNNGNNGNNGTNGTDGTPGGDTYITNITENTFIDNSILENVENIYNDTTNLLTEIVNNTFDTVNNIINNFFEEFPFDLGPIGISLDAVLDDVLSLDLDFINGDQILTVLDEVIDLSPVTNLVEGLTGDILADIGLDVILDPFQYDNSPNDYDVHVGLDVLGLDLPDIDIPLDPVEFLLGDIDVGLDVGQDILGLLPPILGAPDNGDTNLNIPVLDNIALLDPVTNIVDGLFNPVEDLVGDIDVLGDLHVELLNLGADSGGADTDIVIPLDLNLVGNDLLGDQIEISLDPVENLVGDIDLDLGVAANLLGNTADGLIDNIAGGTDSDNILADLGDTLGDTVGGILPLEGEAGDTDIFLGTDLDIPGADLLNEGGEILLDPVENLVGDIDLTGDVGIDLLNVGDSQSVSDTDLSIDIDLIDAGLDPIVVNLDPVEALVGDIDLDVDLSSDVIDMVSDPTTILDGLLDVVENTVDTAVSLLDSIPESTGGLDLGALLPSDDTSGGDVLSSWTETILPDAGNLLGDGLLGGVTDVLPDPVAAAPVIPLPVIPVLPAPNLGGGHFGGLFG